MSELCEAEPPRFGGVRPPLESPLVRGGGAEQPPSFCFTVDKIFFLSIELRRRAIPLRNAGESLACLEVDDDDAPLDRDPMVAYRFSVLKPN
jgi:hypothetical protein